MLQGGQGARAERDRNVMFFVGFSICIRDLYLLHCYCFQTRFFVASPTEMNFKARVVPATGNISFHHYIFHS
jgi:hypothetical protein